MKSLWTPGEFEEHFTLSPAEMTLIGNRRGANRLAFAVFLKFFQYEARSPHRVGEVLASIVQYVAKQVGVPPGQYQFVLPDWLLRPCP